MVFKFLHLSDTHLGYTHFGSRIRAEDMARSLLDAVRTAVAEKVDFILLAGDTFDKKDTEAEFFLHAVQALSPAKDAGIPVFAIVGNHDTAYWNDKACWMNVLNAGGHLHLLAPTPTEDGLVFEPWNPAKRDGGVFEHGQLPVRIVGVPYLGSKTLPLIPKIAAAVPRDDRFNIVMMHCGVSGQIPNTHDALDPGDFAPMKPKADYVALGHYHKRYDVDGFLHNPGGTEHRSVAELEYDHGFYIVTVKDDRSYSIDFRPGKRRPWVCLDIQVAPEETTGSLQAKIDVQLASKLTGAEKVILHIRLSGVLLEQYATLDTRIVHDAIMTQHADKVLVVEWKRDVSSNEAHVMAAHDDQLDMAALERRVFAEQMATVFPHLPEANRHDAAQVVSGIKKQALEKMAPNAILETFTPEWKRVQEAKTP